MLETKLKESIDKVNEIAKAERIPCSDQSSEVLRQVTKEGTRFENIFDNIIRKGKDEID